MTTVNDMPRSCAEAGVLQRVVPLAQIPGEICRRPAIMSGRGKSRARTAGFGPQPKILDQEHPVEELTVCLTHDGKAVASFS